MNLESEKKRGDFIKRKILGALISTMVLLCPIQVQAQNKAQIKAQRGTLSDRDYILLLIKENPTITQEELANIMGKSRRSVQMLMKQLIEDDAIERLGSKKQGIWILK